MAEQPSTGGEPEQLVACTECGRTYPAQVTGEDELRPIGTDGRCACGNDAFVALVEDEGDGVES